MPLEDSIPEIFTAKVFRTLPARVDDSQSDFCSQSLLKRQSRWSIPMQDKWGREARATRLNPHDMTDGGSGSTD